jgi:chromate reductase
MPTLGQPEVFLAANKENFDESGKVSAKTEEFLQNWMNRYVDWVKRHSL